MSEHVLPDKLAFGDACGNSKFHIPSNRVQRRVRANTARESICPLAN